MDTGTRISGLAHVTLIGWAMLGGVFGPPDRSRAVAVTEVSILSEAEFAALVAPAAVSAPAPRPAPAVAPPEPEPAPEPEPEPEPEPAPRPVPDTAAEAPPEADPTPPAPAVETPAPVTPPSPTAPAATDRPAPRPADRVAARPVEAPPPDTEPDRIARPGVAPTPEPDPEADVVEAPRPATAPEAATDRIVTEATRTGDGATAPATSLRPRTRPDQLAAAAQPPAAPTPQAQRPAEPAPRQPEPRQPEPAAPQAPPRSEIEALLAEAMTTPSAPAAAPAVTETGGSGLGQERIGALQLALGDCWNLGAASMQTLRTVVTIRVRLSPEARPESIELIDSTGESEAATRTAFQAARSAVVACSQPNGLGLPPESYDQWRELDLVFNPETMRLR